MANYTTLKEAIADVIKTNGNEEITGEILQQSLLAMINALGLGYQFMGIATPDTSPASPDVRQFYIACTPGTYTAFGATLADGQVAIFEYATAWVPAIIDLVTKTYVDNTFLKIEDLADTTGVSTQTAMTQKAVSDELAQINEDLGDKQDKDTEAVAGNVAVMDNNGNSIGSNVPLTDVATKQELTVATLPGVAEAVIDTDGAGTEQQFTFRKSGGDGGAYYRKIKGKTIVVDDQLASNDAEAVETTGVNQWDEEWEVGKWDIGTGESGGGVDQIRCKNFIPVIGGSVLYFKSPVYVWVLEYDANFNYLHIYQSTIDGTLTLNANTRYIKFYTLSYGATYNYDICINLSNPAINGQYFPYWKRIINIGITTRKDTDGNVPFPNGLQSCPIAQDEATKEGGTIRVGTRAYQAGDESDANVITDGTNTNYALATPVPFTWAEPLNLGVKVDENGTERAVAPEGATAPSAPFVADTTYTMSIARMVAKLASIQ